METPTNKDHLAGVNWNHETQITGLELLKLPLGDRLWFREQIRLGMWERIPHKDIFLNLCHPDNQAYAIRSLIQEATRIL